MRTRSRQISKAVPLEGIASIFSFLEDGVLASLVRGGREYSRATEAALDDFSGGGGGAVTVKSLLATRRRPLRVPEQFTFDGALAAARDGDTILISQDVTLIRDTIRLPNIRLTIVGARRPRLPFGRELRSVPYHHRRHVTGGHSAAISHWGACSIYSAVADEPALLAEGSETKVTLRDLSIYGASRDFDYEPPWINEDDDDDDEEFESDMYDTAVEVRSGACVNIDNCSLTNCGHASVFAKGGARVHVSDSFISRGWFGVKADGDRASIILSRCRMSGDNHYACCVVHGANIEVYDTEVGDDYTEFHGSGFIVNGEGSRMVLDEDVFHFPSQIENHDPSRGRSEFFIVIDNGTLIVHCDHFRDPRYGNPLRLLQDKDIDFGLFPGREWSGAGKTEPVPEGYAIIHSSGWQG